MKHKYEKVKEEIISWAVNEKYKPHEKIPTESELMELFKVSRHTIRRAISDLAAEKYLYRLQGSGIYVSDFKQNEIYLTNNKNVGVLTTYISNYIFPDIIRGIEDTLYDESYSLLLSSTKNNIMLESSNLKNLLAHKIDGLIVEPTKSAYQSPNMGYFNNLIEQDIPFIMINASYSQVKVPSLCVDDLKGGNIAAKYLITLGHKNIAGIFKVDDLQGVHRMNGFITGCQESNVLLRQDKILTYLSEETNTLLPEKIKNVLKQEKRPTGIFCYNDEIAYMVLNIAYDLKLKVPEDLSIIGFDDSPMATIMEPKLTSITHPKEKMGIDAAKLIIRLINNNNHFSECDSILYEPEIVIRSSTASI
ncbi:MULTISPECIES: GntR family transcriptional regulator [Clostridium]|uniref:Arabinose metabolism transcriptional repressor n=3 Tax=Clostridium TaxID=1485 RepID=D8GK99_CLOLD|nr:MULTISPECIES: GntR family transcriptional regulator [Clostridium]ADK13217.1 predicted transcriptional regulator, LacI family [Clostridium ljungdahlii DSM 13528]ALU36605.1 Transcriptional regulator GntR family [Clostridium autoethanogenum DSM 10061]OAA83416.1 Arabinose metabolism transcriptional repressor [Clostridium ljungdahlii DSM 13528]OAA85074.1 Arabinose metabolism transcriptional repressor [Clostridium coskatii]OBR97744.1 arabinose metabolism transcriptional repressor [Clostridium cos